MDLIHTRPAFMPIAAVLLPPIHSQLGLPVILTKITKWRAIIIATIVLLSFALYPTWPLAWLSQAKNYDGFIPLLVFPPLVSLALSWKDPRCLFLLLFAAMPQRGIYDLAPLFLIPRSRRPMLVLAAVSWVAFAVERFYLQSYGPRLATILVYSAAATILIIGMVKDRCSFQNSAIAKILSSLKF